MYKTRVQELCHQKLLPLPKYTTTKEGPDHNPRFRASVVVGELSFDGPDQCRSTKEAQSEAARIAIDHFSDTSPPFIVTSGSLNVSSVSSNEPKINISLEASQLCSTGSNAAETSDAKGFVEKGVAQTMYKTELQEICHQKMLPLPKYTTTKEGPDHNPQFQASVVVGELSFDGRDQCKSSKEAQSEAARIAINHLSDAFPAHITTPGSSNASCSTATNSGSSNRDSLETSQLYSAGSNVAETSTRKCFLDVEFSFKSRLQNYAQKRNLNLPSYECTREGSLHALRFKVKVSVGEQTFESPKFCSSLKEAENMAAKCALMSLTGEGNHEEEPAFFKNLLQELAQKECLSPPLYNTVTDIAANIPTFKSTVDVEGEKFVGICAKTKKQAEHNAAKVAWQTLNERKASKCGRSPFFSFEVQEDLKIAPMRTMPGGTSLQESGALTIPISCITEGDGMAKVESMDSLHSNQGGLISNECPDNLKTNIDKSADTSHVEPEHKVASKESTKVVTAFEPVCSQLSDLNTKDRSSSGNEDGILSKSSPCKSSDHAVADAAFTTGGCGSSSLSKQRISIYPRKPDMVLPQGAMVLPFSDEKWVAVSFDLSNL